MLVQLSKDPVKRFNDIYSGVKTSSTPAFNVDISEDATGFHIEAELPGIDKKQIALKVEDDILTIKAERKQETEENNKGYLRIERTYGSLQRQFNLGESIDQENINADYHNGILHVTLPKAQQTNKTKTISIN